MDRLHRLALRLAWLGLRAYWWLFRPEVHGAAVLVRVDDRLLLVRNSYRRAWTIPGGRLARGESPRDAAARELWEETGIQVEAAALVAAGRVVCTALGSRDHVSFFELRLPAEPGVRVDGREVVEARFEPEGDVVRRDLWPALRQLFEEAARPGGGAL